MASDSEKDSCPNALDEIWTKEREEYAEDPAAWLSKLFHATRDEVHEEIKYHTAQQEEQTKAFLQAVANSQRRYGRAVESQLIFWLGIIAIIVAAPAGVFGLSDGLVIGAVFVGLVVVGRVYLWTWLMRKHMTRLDQFRRRFRELLDDVNDIRWQTRPEEMIAEDKAFLDKYKDSILFPSVIPDDSSDRIPSDRDLVHTETLYLEYRDWSHLHLRDPWPDPNDPNSNTKLKCELCMTADRVQKHIEGALSAFESYLESQRQKLVTQIDNGSAAGAVDAKGFLDDYRAADLANQDEKLLAWLNSLCDKECWTFEDADRVRELCRSRGKEESTWLEWWKQEGRFGAIFDKLTTQMKNAATRYALADAWDWYDSARDWLAKNEKTVAGIRRILGRHNPKAMFRELNEQFEHPFMDITIRLPGITKWGYDPKLGAKERKVAANLMSKELDKYDRQRDRELRAMHAFIRAENHDRG